VIVLDRIQVYPELTTGSARPLPEEFRGTERVYLTERRVADGEISAAESHALLLKRVAQLGSRHELLIMEGGSISLMQEICAHPLWRRHPLTLQYTPPPKENLYRERLERRIRAMLQPSSLGTSILSELATVWSDERTHAFVETICGYDTLLSWCRERGISPVEIESHAQDPDVMEDLVPRVLEAHITYAYSQVKAYDRFLPLLRAMGASESAPMMEQKAATG
jgi:tRNA A37 N6-isopentenylltransferase MiaA